MSDKILIHTEVKEILDDLDRSHRETIKDKLTRIVEEDVRDFSEFGLEKVWLSEGTDIYRLRIAGYRIFTITHKGSMVVVGLKKRDGAYDSLTCEKRRANEFRLSVFDESTQEASA